MLSHKINISLLSLNLTTYKASLKRKRNEKIMQNGFNKFPTVLSLEGSVDTNFCAENIKGRRRMKTFLEHNMNEDQNALNELLDEIKKEFCCVVSINKMYKQAHGSQPIRAETINSPSRTTLPNRRLFYDLIGFFFFPKLIY